MEADHRGLTEEADRTGARGPGWFEPWRRWLDAALHREVLRVRARYELSMDELRGLYVSDERVDRLLTDRIEDASVVTRIDALDDRLEGLVAATRFGDVSPLAAAAGRFRLTPTEVLALAVCLAPEVDLSYQSVFAYLNDDVSRRLPTVDLCQRLAGGALDPRGPAVADGLLEVVPDPAAALWRCSGLLLAEPVRRHLLDRSHRHDAGVPASTGLTVLAARLPGDADEEAAAWALALHRELVRPDRSVEDLAARLRLAMLEARLTNGALHVTTDDLGSSEESAAGDVRRCCRTLAAAPVPALLTGPPEVVDRLPLDGVDHDRRRHRLPDPRERSRVWTCELLRHGLTPVAADVAEVAALFRLTRAQIRTAAAAVARTGAAGLPQLTRAARDTSTSAIAAVAQRVPPTHTWGDLVLPGATLARLRELASAVQHRDEVFGEWGFARRAGGHTSVRALFSGPPGTGKTMSASVLGAELGLDVFRVDLASVVSKYIGETEKNLDRILSAAEHSNAIVLFDEADALFGKRSEVKDSHDRYANIEVAFLLQRLETFDGIAVLATNLPGNLDEAFGRRIHFHVDFPPPDQAARLRLWQQAFPPETPLADDLDPEFLAGMFPLTGGEVQAAALLASFLAAHEEEAVGMRHAVRALARLRRGQGKLPSASEFGEFMRVAHEEVG